MPRVAMNKGSLRQLRNQLALYQRFLPSLDLKRQQLLTELRAAQDMLDRFEQDRAVFHSSLASLFSLVGASGIDLSRLARVESVDLTEENRLGVRLPVVRSIEFDMAAYSTLAMPFWVDGLANAVQKAATLQIAQQVHLQRVRLLERAVRRTTQRVNLFEKVLIPATRENIRRIAVYLSDAERSAVVRSKFAKARHLAGDE